MTAVVNSLADDEFAHAYDFQATPDVDESIDGICEDSLGRCTLRAALEEADILGQPAYVTFSVVGILSMDPLQGSFIPTDGSRIYGTQQEVTIFGSGAGTPAMFILDNQVHITGIQLDNALIGIIIGGDGNRIGLDNLDDATYIGGMVQNGILIAGDNNRVTGNVIGLDLNHNPNANQFGIFITGKENIIGGTDEGHRNIISANDIGIGVYTIGGDTSNAGNYIIGNQIGTDVSGEAARGNRVGINIIGPNVLVGGNTISGNTQSGVLTGLDAVDILISKNYIGLDVMGQDFIPNRDGVVLGPGSSSCKVDSNYIMGNTAAGIQIAGIDNAALHSTLHYIRGNEISMNNGPGILISDFVTHTTIGSSAITDFPSNWIHHNSIGVAFTTFGGLPRHNTIRKNVFNDHAGKAINIYTLCPACQEQTFPPVITTYEEVDPVTAIITGTHHAAGSKIDIYIGDLNLAGHFEGGTWLGSATVDANHDFILTVDNCQCDIVATATHPNGSTSEFTDGIPLITAVDDISGLTISTSAYPNPFDREVTIHFTLQESESIKLEIYDVMGQKVEWLVDDHLLAGEYLFNWSPKNASAGIYYFSLISARGSAVTGKLILLQ